MKPILYLLIVLILLQFSSQYHINYQAHGFNDLDYFIQLLQKGVDIFKFDVSLSTEESCLKQSTWKKGDDKCEQLSYAMETCCLLLRGDQSPSPIFEYPANTTDEFVSIFSSGKYDYILSKEKALDIYSNRILIAINLQYLPYTINDMTKRFFYNLFKAINDRNLNVELIFGHTQYITDYDEKCAKGLCSPEEQYISDFPVILQSENYELPTLVKERRFNFNTNYYKISKYCQQGFPDWVDEKNEFPCIFWEPSHEDGMQWTFEQWFDTKCKIPPSKTKKSDYQQANNQEPEMQQVFLQGTNSTLSGQKYLFKNQQSPVLEYLEQEHLYVIGYKDVTSQQSFLQIVSSDLQIVSKLPMGGSPQYLKVAQLENQNNEVIGYVIQAIMTHSIELYKYEIQSQKLSTYKLDSQNRPKNFLSSSIFSISGNVYSYVLSVNSETEIKFQYVELGSVEKILTQQIIDIKNTGIIAFDIIDADFQVLGDNGILVFNMVGKTSEMYAMFYDFNNFNHRNLKEINLKTNGQNIFKGQISHFAYGKRPVVKLYYDESSKKVFFLLVSTHGFSQSGVHFNNAGFNKCKYYQFQGFEELVNLKYVMNYIWGRIDDLKEKVQSGEIVTACSNNIHHGSFNNGDKPSIILKKSNEDDKNYYTAHVLHEYVDYFYLPAPTKLFCGANGRYIANDNPNTPRPSDGENELQIIENAVMFEHFSLVPFEVFKNFE